MLGSKGLGIGVLGYPVQLYRVYLHWALNSKISTCSMLLDPQEYCDIGVRTLLLSFVVYWALEALIQCVFNKNKTICAVV